MVKLLFLIFMHFRLINMDKFIKSFSLDVLKINRNSISTFSSTNLLQRRIVIPVSVLGLVYLIFIRRVGFDRGCKFRVKNKVKEDEEFSDREHRTVTKKSPSISGWLFTKIYKVISTSVFGSVILQALKRKFKMNMLRTLEIPESPMYYPIVNGEEGLYIKSAVSEDDLWHLVNARTSIKHFHFTTISDLVNLYREKRLTPVDVAKRIIAALKKSKKQNPSVTAFVEYYEELIMQQAVFSTERWEDGKPLSVFDGIPVGVKDEYAVAGHHCRNGLPIKELDVKMSSKEERGLVKRLREGGAMIIGMTNMHQIGIGVFGINQSKYHGTTRNPYNVNHSAGGSSGGSAGAIAAGLCTIALGTDGGGSIRLPAAVCGVVGLKATYTRYSDAGVSQNASTVSHTGALCATVMDAAISYGYLAGKDEDCPLGLCQPPVYLGDFCSTELSGMKIGVDWQWMDVCDREINSACLDLLEWLEKDCGVEIVSIHVPEKEEMYVAHSMTILAEMASANQRLFEQHFDELNVDVQSMLLAARSIDAHDYLQAARQRRRSVNALKYIFTKVDAIFTPGVTEFQPVVTSSIERYGYTNYGKSLSLLRYHGMANLTGIPGICQPIGYSKVNLPISIQWMSSWWREDILFRIAYAVEKHVDIKKADVYFDIS